MPDDEPRTLLCSPTSGVGEDEVVPGSVHRWCMICGDEIWVSPLGLRMCDQHPKTKIVCLTCGIGDAADHEDAKFEAIPGFQADPDILRAIKKVVAVERAARRAR